MPTTTAPHAFTDLLSSALTEPGRIHEAYTAFHGYSLGNQLLALAQCHERGIAPGPIATFPRWKDRGRFVRKGEKALTLCMPVTVKATPSADAPADEPETTFTRFIHRPRWFVLSQTDGTDYQPVSMPAWSEARALEQLAIARIDFTAPDGNVQGFARRREIAVSPLAALPHKTLFHELAHVLLGHTAELAHQDDEQTPRSLREVEAESVAMLCCAALELPGIEYSRGYIQHWHASGQPIPEKSAARIFKAADQILRAGQSETVTSREGDE
jgi:antirestriction protein ArdC